MRDPHIHVVFGFLSCEASCQHATCASASVLGILQANLDLFIPLPLCAKSICPLAAVLVVCICSIALTVFGTPAPMWRKVGSLRMLNRLGQAA